MKPMCSPPIGACSPPGQRLKPGRKTKEIRRVSREAVLRKLEPIFRTVIDPNLVLTEELKHIILVVEIEMQLGVALTTDELAHLRNVSELVTLLQQKGLQA
jgi:acyl carrier protein